jgi:hypothetical protein
MTLMTARFDPCPEDLQRLQVGPIGPHMQSFAALVSQQGYCRVNGWLKVRLASKLSHWLQQHRVPLAWIVGSEDVLNRLALLFAWEATEHRRVRGAWA